MEILVDGVWVPVTEEQDERYSRLFVQPGMIVGGAVQQVAITKGITMESKTIVYDDVEELKSVLVGQKITEITETTGAALERDERRRNGQDADSYYYGRSGTYDRVLEYHLSNGATLRAHARDGGCACSNGCFSVDIDDETRSKIIGATIMNVSTEERTS